MVLSCLIADDEPLAHQLLEHYIGRLKTLSIAGHAYNAFEVLDFLSENKVDLLFLDIQMPDLSGLDMLKTLSQPPMVILTTAYSEHSLEAYDLGVMDYLLKPIKFERFLKAVNRVLELKREAAPIKQEAAATPTQQDYLFLKDGTAEHKIRVEDITYVQAYGNFVKVHTIAAQTIVATITMKQLEAALPETAFIRVHKSYIVQVEQLTRLEKESVFVGATEIPVGAMYKLLLEKRLRGH
jgi:DNA-binding LytR/AlgR family response regulator